MSEPLFRVVVHRGPDALRRYEHTRYWWSDYHPGDPRGEHRTAERGQVFFCELPPPTQCKKED